MPALLMAVLMLAVITGTRRMAISVLAVICTATALHTHSGWYVVLAVIGWVLVYYSSPLERINKTDFT